MGRLYDFNLEAWHGGLDRIASGSGRFFIETGTGLGDSLRFAAGFRFDGLFSIEIEPSLARKAMEWAQAPSVILNQDSVSGLARALKQIPDGSDLLIWLDAHFPGADHAGAAYDDASVDEQKRLPLTHELETIGEARERFGTVTVIIDDLRIWRSDLLFENGPCPPHAQPRDGQKAAWAQLDTVIANNFPGHERYIDTRAEGYIALLPPQLNTFPTCHQFMKASRVRSATLPVVFTGVVIAHPEKGIYLGQRNGLPIWSMYQTDCITAPVFASEADARSYALGWELYRPDLGIDPYNYPGVSARLQNDEKFFATVDDLRQAGLDHHLS